MPEEQKSPSSNIAMAVLAYFIFFIPLLTEDKKDPFVMYHVKQGLTTTIFFIAYSVVCQFLFISRLYAIFWLWYLVWIALVIVWIIGITNAASGKKSPVPIIGKIGEGFKF